jgi:alpha-1,3-mannosyltransferase
LPDFWNQSRDQLPRAAPDTTTTTAPDAGLAAELAAMRPVSLPTIRTQPRQAFCFGRRIAAVALGGLICCLALWNALRAHHAVERHVYNNRFNTEKQLASIMDKLGDFPMERFSQQAIWGHLRATFGGEAGLELGSEGQQEPEEGAGELYAVHQYLMQYTQVLLCGRDASAAALRPPNGTKYLLAADFHNSEEVLPNFIVQAMRLALLLPPGGLFVSVYESGSADHSAQWLELLRMLLFIAGVPHAVTTNGDILRTPGSDRVAHLATIRNAALLPLTTGTFPADAVVFTNDVFFCAEEVVRLMQHRADAACATDLKRSFYSLPEQRRRQAMAAALQRRSHLPAFLARALAGNGLAYRLWKGLLGGARAVLPELPLLFYDTWVARDVGGRRVQRAPPHSQEATTALRLEQGLPVRVYCCWNGLVVLRAAPLRQGLRFRRHQPRECPASECSLLCDDLHRLGHHGLVMDPSARVAYTWRDALDRYEQRFVEGMGLSSWEHTVTHTPWDELKMAQPRRQECCALRLGREEVDFERDCAWYRVYDKNFTAAALAGLAV